VNQEVLAIAEFTRGEDTRALLLSEAGDEYEVALYRNDEVFPLFEKTYPTYKEAMSAQKDSFEFYRRFLASAMWVEKSLTIKETK